MADRRIYELSTTADIVDKYLALDKSGNATAEKILVSDISGGSYTFGSGLTESGGAVRLGGTLAQDTTIDGAGAWIYTLTNTTGITLNVTAGIQTADILMVVDDIKIQTTVFGTTFQQIHFDPATGMYVTDSIMRGLQYTADYSATFVDRSLVDKAYVDSSGGAWASQTLTADVTIDADSGTYDIIFSETQTVQLHAGGTFGSGQRSDLYLGSTFSWFRCVNPSDESGWVTVTADSARIEWNDSVATMGIDCIGSTGIIVSDEILDKGMEYAADYSSNYTARSIVDKAYVDSGGGLSLGTNDQIPWMNGAGTDFQYNDNLKFNGTTLTVYNGSYAMNLSAETVAFERNSTNYIRCTTTGGILVFLTDGRTGAATESLLILDSEKAILKFGTGATTTVEKLRTDSLGVIVSGFLGINDSSPAATLEVVTPTTGDVWVGRFHNTDTTTDSWGIRVQQGTTTVAAATSYISTVRAIDNSGGDVGLIGWDDTGFDLINFYSSKEFKKDIAATKIKGIEAVKAVRPRSYKLKAGDTKREHEGYIIEELQNNMPDVIKEVIGSNGKPILGISETKIIKYLHQAVIELSDQVEYLENQIKST